MLETTKLGDAPEECVVLFLVTIWVVLALAFLKFERLGHVCMRIFAQSSKNGNISECHFAYHFAQAWLLKDVVAIAVFGFDGINQDLVHISRIRVFESWQRCM